MWLVWVGKKKKKFNAELDAYRYAISLKRDVLIESPSGETYTVHG